MFKGSKILLIHEGQENLKELKKFKKIKGPKGKKPPIIRLLKSHTQYNGQKMVHSAISKISMHRMQ